MKIFLIMALAFPAVADVAAFDVASVKPHVAAGSGSSISRPGGRLTIEGASLKEILFYAHGIAWGREYALSGPDWLNSERFDVVATFPPETSRERVREMLRALLGERFGLRTHDENRKLESYVLLPARHGPKLTPNTTGAEGAFITGEDGLTADHNNLPRSRDAARRADDVFEISPFHGRPGRWPIVLGASRCRRTDRFAAIFGPFRIRQAALRE